MPEDLTNVIIRVQRPGEAYFYYILRTPHYVYEVVSVVKKTYLVKIQDVETDEQRQDIKTFKSEKEIRDFLSTLFHYE